MKAHPAAFSLGARTSRRRLVCRAAASERTSAFRLGWSGYHLSRCLYERAAESRCCGWANLQKRIGERNGARAFLPASSFELGYRTPQASLLLRTDRLAGEKSAHAFLRDSGCAKACVGNGQECPRSFHAPPPANVPEIQKAAGSRSPPHTSNMRLVPKPLHALRRFFILQQAGRRR